MILVIQSLNFRQTEIKLKCRPAIQKEGTGKAINFMLEFHTHLYIFMKLVQEG